MGVGFVICIILFSFCQSSLQEEFLKLDGSGNNVNHPSWGAPYAPYKPLGNWTPVWGEGGAVVDGWQNTRELIATIFHPDRTYKPEASGLSNLIIDFAISALHEMGGHRATLCSSPICLPVENMTVTFPTCDPVYDPNCLGNQSMKFARFAALNVSGSRQIPYSRTAWLDLDLVYGISEAECPRTRDGGRILEVAEEGRVNDFMKSKTLSSPEIWWWNTLWTREHNRLAGEYNNANNSWTDEELFQKARKMNIAKYQKIMAREYLAAVTGSPLPPYQGYNATLEPKVDPFWKHVVAKYGHYSLNTILSMMTGTGLYVNQGFMSLTDLWKDWPSRANDPDSLEYLKPLLLGMSQSPSYDIMLNAGREFQSFNNLRDILTIDRLRTYDLGLPKYNDMREAYGLSRATSFTQVFGPEPAALLAKLFATVDDVDALLGVFAEKHSVGQHFGPLGVEVFRRQFANLRDSDRFWYENAGVFTPEEQRQILQSNLQTIMATNFELDLQGSNLFFVAERQLDYQGKATLFPDDGTYVNRLDLSFSYRLSWTARPQAQEVDFMLQVATSGWVGIGFGADPGTMKNADIILCRIVNGQLEVRDSFARDVGVPTLDTELGGTSDVTNTTGSEVGGITTVKFTRKFNTKDAYDKVIVDAAQKVIFAFQAQTKDFVYHGPTRNSQRQINFLEAKPSECECKK